MDGVHPREVPMLSRFLRLSALPSNSDLGLLLLRITAILPLFLKHGIEKLFTFSQMAAHFPDPLHIGPIPSLLFAMVSDGICSLLILLGLATRWAAAVVCVNLFVAWALVHHFEFLGHQADHGELIVLYMAVTLSLFFTGAGKWSLDAWLAGRK